MSISRVYKIINDIDDLVYIGSTVQLLCQRITEHRKAALKGRGGKLYDHMRDIGSERFKILPVREYKDISKERLRYKEDKYIKRFDTVKNGLNAYYSYGDKCEHNVCRYTCKTCKGSFLCSHGKYKRYCKECKGCDICPHNKQKYNCKDCHPGVCDICLKVLSRASLRRHKKTKHPPPAETNQIFSRV